MENKTILLIAIYLIVIPIVTILATKFFLWVEMNKTDWTWKIKQWLKGDN